MYAHPARIMVPLKHPRHHSASAVHSSAVCPPISGSIDNELDGSGVCQAMRYCGCMRGWCSAVMLCVGGMLSCAPWHHADIVLWGVPCPTATALMLIWPWSVPCALWCRNVHVAKTRPLVTTPYPMLFFCTCGGRPRQPMVLCSWDMLPLDSST